MAKKVLLKDENSVEILPITRGELILDSSGKQALHSDEFLATTSQPGLMSKEDKSKIDNISISTLEITDLLPNGKKIATVSVGSTSYNILAPASYNWSEINNKPTNLSQFTDDVVAGKYLSLSGGTLNGALTISGNSLMIDMSGYGNAQAKFKNMNGTGLLIYVKEFDWRFVNEDFSEHKYILHSGNFSNYALPKDGTAVAATKLATPRTIWGQSFDGTGDVNGIFFSTGAYGGFALYGGIRENEAAAMEVLDSNGSWKSHGITLLQNGNVGIGGVTASEKLEVHGNVKANKFTGNIDGTYVNKLTGYTKAATIAAITESDSLNTALGKLELKSETTYELVKGAYDGDGTIENLAEILKVLEGIKDTDTIQAIVGKYLPLSGGTITGDLHVNTFHINKNNFSLSNSGTFWIGVDTNGELFRTDSGWYNSYRILDSLNYSTYALPLSGGILTGDLTFKASSANGFTPKIHFLRGTFDDTYQDWSVGNESGGLHFYCDYGEGVNDILTLGKTSATITGTLTVTGNVTAPKFIGALQGNADTATTATKIGTYTVNDIFIRQSRPDTGFNIDEIELFGMRDIQPSSEITRTGTFPFDGWGSLMSFNGQNYFVQLATSGTSSGMYFRSAYGAAVKLTDKPWVKFLDSSNYTDYTVKKDGTGASGTWGINISGSSGSSATSTQTSYLKILDVRGTNHGPNSTTYPGYNVTAWFNNTGTPVGDWYSGLTFRGWHDGYASWQLCSYSSTGTANDYNLYFRNGNNDTWGSWKTILDSSNYSSTLDNRYYTETEVNNLLGNYYPITGGNMSGDNRWIGSTMGGGTDYWRIGGYGSSDNGTCIITIGDNYNDKFAVEIADYSGTTYRPLEVVNTGINVNGYVKATQFHLSNTAANYCGLMPNSVITSGGNDADIWLYNTNAVSIYGSSINLNNNTTVTGNITFDTNRMIRWHQSDSYSISSPTTSTGAYILVKGFEGTTINKRLSVYKSSTSAPNTSYQLYTDGSLYAASATIGGSTKITGGSDFTLQASSSASTDPGDLVFANSNGTELGRIWLNGSHFLLRYGSSDPSKIILHEGNYNSYAPKLDGTGATGTWGINISGSATTCTGNAVGLSSSGYGSNNLTYLQTSGSFFGNSGWSHYIIANHGDGSSYYNYTIALPFWDVPKYKRLEGGTEDGWHTFVTSENYTSYLGYIGTTAVQSTSNTQALTGISRINNSTTAHLYLGNSGNQGWVMTQDICSHSGSGNWAINVAGNSWFKQVNIGYTYTASGSGYALNISGNAGISGNVYATAYYESSDIRLKNFIKDVSVDLNKIRAIPKKYFTWKKDTSLIQIGTSAQAVQKLYPELVSSNTNGYLSVDYSKLSVIALKGIDELYDMILELRAENRQLREQIRQLQK